MLKKTWEAIKKHESHIFLILGLILVATISFETGFLKGQKRVTDPIIIEKPSESPKMVQESTDAQKTDTSLSGQETYQDAQNKTNPGQEQCRFVGSKNSDKYHIPTCQWAKRIKPENKVCFSSEEDAKSRGYVADKCVIENGKNNS